MEQPEISTPPRYYPVFLDLRGARCLVVGGGKVARRKVEGLLEAGAAVTVVAPVVVPLPAGVEIHRRGYISEDLDGVTLVIAATDDPVLNARVSHEARARGMWVNVVDDPEQCTVVFPAVVRRGALQIAISTSGASPTLARRLREALEVAYGPEYGELTALLWQLRRAWEPRAIAAEVPPATRQAAWEQVLALPILDLLRAGRRQEAEDVAQQVLEDVL
jgi:precorrin-2 dehydrogenase/sirohydrochlorin ferrochelatase